MTGSRPRATRAEVAEAIRQIKAYHAQGKQSLKELPERGRYGDRAIATQAKQRGWTETKLRKARQFASPEAGYSKDRLNELFRLLREHRPVFGVSHVGILVTASWSEGRAKLQRRCILENWSKDQLEAKVKARLGPRRFGGRRRRVAEDPVQALVQVDEMADTWRRWYDIASEEPSGSKGAKSVLDRLPEPVRAEVHKVNGAMRRLRKSLAEELAWARGK
jgi:hypothetical protein